MGDDGGTEDGKAERRRRSAFTCFVIIRQLMLACCGERPLAGAMRGDATPIHSEFVVSRPRAPLARPRTPSRSLAYLLHIFNYVFRDFSFGSRLDSGYLSFNVNGDYLMTESKVNAIASACVDRCAARCSPTERRDTRPTKLMRPAERRINVSFVYFNFFRFVSFRFRRFFLLFSFYSFPLVGRLASDSGGDDSISRPSAIAAERSRHFEQIEFSLNAMAAISLSFNEHCDSIACQRDDDLISRPARGFNGCSYGFL